MRVGFSSAVLGLTIAVLVSLGCAPSDPEAEPLDEAPTAAVATERVPEATELVGAWLLEDLSGRGVMDMVQTTLTFEGEGRASGSGGCNRFTGSYTFIDGELALGPFAGTKMMCPEAVMDQEDRFHQALGAVERVVVDGPFLLIYVEGSEQPLKFTRVKDVVEL